MEKNKKSDSDLHVSKKVAGGGATGAVLGAVVGGPIGAVVGGALGALVGSAVDSTGTSSNPGTADRKVRRSVRKRAQVKPSGSSAKPKQKLGTSKSSIRLSSSNKAKSLAKSSLKVKGASKKAKKK
ncbi:MAG: hypothetical protein ABI651_19175 [Verrucomicrobiota bacterium]